MHSSILVIIASRKQHPACTFSHFIRTIIFRRPEALCMTSRDIVLGLVGVDHIFGLLIGVCSTVSQGCTFVASPHHGLDEVDFLQYAMDDIGVTLNLLCLN